MLIDTHSHINFNMFRDDADQVVQNSLAEDIWMIVAGADYKTSKRALDYANKYERGVYAAVGLHPTHLFPMEAEGDDYDYKTYGEEFHYDIYEKLAKFEKTVAIGEIGLDYYHFAKDVDVSEQKEKQQEVLYQQLLLARRLDLPVIIHCRQAHDDMVAVLTAFKKEYRELVPTGRPWGVMHCFSGDEDLAWKYFNIGLIVSFTGLITFSRQWDDVIRRLPSDKYMIETDCPYMTPEPFRGQRNEPMLVKYIAKKIAEIKNLSEEKIGNDTTRNARNLFGI